MNEERFKTFDFLTQQKILCKLAEDIGDKEAKIRADWTRDKKCDCVDKVYPGRILVCDCVKNEIKQQTNEERKIFRKLDKIWMSQVHEQFMKKKQEELNCFELNDFLQ